ncbi:MAG: hypothetical protein IPK82_18265 [Polyangiaceae bacterium]|nr:hypothetical protein [Polyangiaceae bacterium]
MLTTLGRVALWAMEVANDDDRVLAEIGRLTALLSEITNQPDSVAALGALLRYILATHERLDRSVLKTALSSALEPPIGDQVVTVYEQLIMEGRATMLLDLLAAKFGPIPAASKDRVQNASNQELVAWGVRVLTATTLDEVFVAVPTRRRAKKNTRSAG